MSVEATWLGTQKGPNTVENEPQSENFFTNTDVLTSQSILVRESVQNAIDARASFHKGPVRMTFRLGQVDPGVASKYFGTLYPRIDASLGSRHVPAKDAVCTYLAIEDFGTTGLLGSISSERPKEEEGNSFWYFAWATGKSNKSDGTRGKNGVGKIVFPRSSGIKSQLVLSVRKNDEAHSPILFGNSLLKLHDLEGHRWLPECRWMTEDAGGEHVPFTDLTAIENFCVDWPIERSLDQPGTSILVPFCDPSFSAQKLIQCIIQDYFVAIIDGTIECKVIDSDGQSFHITSATIESHLADLDEELLTRSSKTKDELMALCDLYKSKVGGHVRSFAVIESGDKKINKWDHLVISDEDKVGATASLEEGEPIEFRVAVTTPAQVDGGGKRVEDQFSVLLLKKDGALAVPTFAREGILIPSAASSSNRYKDLMALVVVESGPLADVLGQAEGPSHERWSAEEAKFREKYIKSQGAELIRFVKESANKIVRMLQAAQNEAEDVHYAKWFPISDGSSKTLSDGLDDPKPNTGKKTGTKGKRGKPGNVEVGFEYIKTSSGFKVVPAGIDPPRIGTKVVLKGGYAQIRGGSPLAKSSDDFILKNQHLKSSGVKLLTWDENHLTFAITEKSFELEFANFDVYRDLVVGVNRVD
jgi:hypothetical protein